MYDPHVGRWTTEDPIWPADHVNPFVYADNAPTNATDPDGRQAKDIAKRRAFTLAEALSLREDMNRRLRMLSEHYSFVRRELAITFQPTYPGERTAYYHVEEVDRLRKLLGSLASDVSWIRISVGDQPRGADVTAYPCADEILAKARDSNAGLDSDIAAYQKEYWRDAHKNAADPGDRLTRAATRFYFGKELAELEEKLPPLLDFATREHARRLRVRAENRRHGEARALTPEEVKKLDERIAEEEWRKKHWGWWIIPASANNDVQHKERVLKWWIAQAPTTWAGELLLDENIQTGQPLTEDEKWDRQRNLMFAHYAGAMGQALRPASSGLREVGSRGIRNTAPLTAAQQAEIWQAVRDLRLNSADVVIVRGPSRLVEFSDFSVIGIGPNAFPSALGPTTGSVFERLTPRAVVAHEAGHMITTRAGTAFPGGGLLDEFQASLVGRTLPGLTSTERFQLLRDAVERARAAGVNPRDLIGQLQHLPGK